MSRRQTVVAFAAWMLCGLMSLAVAGEPPLSAFANTSDVVIRLKNPKQTIEKAAAMAATTDEKVANMIRENAPFIGMLISNPALAGVDQEQDWLVVAQAKSDADPAVVFCIPATDAAIMQAALPEKMKKFARDGWVFYSEDAAAIEALQGSAPSDGGITSKIDSASKQLFDRGDFSVFLNIDHLTEVYKGEIESGSSELSQRLARRASILSMIPGMSADSGIEGGTEAGKVILKDTRAFTSALVITPNGLNFETLGQFKPGTATAQAMAGHPGDPLATISRLPEGAVLYVGLSGKLGAKAESGLATSASLAEPMDEQQQKLDELKQALASVTYKSFAAALGLGHREEGIVRLASITEATPTAQVRDFKQSASELMEVELTGQGIKQESEYKRDAETAAGRPVDVMTVTTTVDPDVNPFFGGILTKINLALFGPRGMEMRYSYWDDKILFALGGGPEAMEAAVKHVEATSGNGTEPFREGLLEQPNVLVMLDVKRIAYRALKAASEMEDLNLQIDPKVIGAEEPAPSFIGLTVGTEVDALRSKTQVPSGQLFRIAELYIYARMMQQQQRSRPRQ
ncbi:MAG: hypothetical protein JNG89_02545 [Planctomycetaceae bacterium]|nr:hypothetical protein [Planctomycetaceae bacterium]